MTPRSAGNRWNSTCPATLCPTSRTIWPPTGTGSQTPMVTRPCGRRPKAAASAPARSTSSSANGPGRRSAARSAHISPQRRGHDVGARSARPESGRQRSLRPRQTRHDRPVLHTVPDHRCLAPTWPADRTVAQAVATLNCETSPLTQQTVSASIAIGGAALLSCTRSCSRAAVENRSRHSAIARHRR